ncbi:MAG: outer membrane beta-barrel protein [Melioribacteraceae bacterium]|nr:outer membrane beta-barrel protein [Saprospiraceae bacterium]MCF8355906.1 outer membrane beta-barrel protein [Melioribacteraceae bacterium]MCF8395446.1 outer membrane beta-barrel protein [Melioribacteraceae bacterium]
MSSKRIVFIIFFLLVIQTYSQSLYFGLSSGISSVQDNNYFTNNLGAAGKHYVNGAESIFGGLKFGNDEYQFAIKMKYGFSDIPFSLSAQIHYIPLRGSQSVDIYNSVYNQNILQDVTTMIDIWSLRIGGRYTYEADKFKPYTTLSLLLNYWGDTWLQYEYYDNISLWRNYENGIRYGLNMGGGIGYELVENIELEIEVNYNYMNLWNRRGANPIDKIHPSEEEKMNTLNFELCVYYKLL